jgi:DNA-binding winged helix-turn-helix (wHTH) protein
MEEFFINNRFLINPALNLVRDTTGNLETHLEPRIMQLLTILCRNCGKLITREELVKEVWNDYGGADEGLTQAISFLRKTLDDSSKNVIKTIPKKGYILQASITCPGLPGNGVEQKYDAAGNLHHYRFLIVGLIVVGVIAISGYYLLNNRVSKQEPAAIEVAFPNSQEEEDNNPLTTVTTTDSVGNRYRLVMIGDRRPTFYVNDSLQLDQEPYDRLIDVLAKELWRRQKEAEAK